MLDSLFKGLGPDMSWMKDRTIYLARHGSHAYGTNIEGSDEDFRGVAIPPKEYFTGFLKNFECLVRNQPDVTIFDIKKFMTLALENNPNTLEILFVNEKDILHVTPLGEKLLAVKNDFLSRASRERFMGYAKSQLHRIESHKKWLMEPPEAPPTRAECGLPEVMTIPKEQLLAVESQLEKKLDTWRPDFEPFSEAQQIYLQTKVKDYLAEITVTSKNDWMCAARTLGYSENFIRLLQLERDFKVKRKNWENYQGWKQDRNEKRAALEAQFGFDTKHGMHLIRLMRMALEILTYGKMNVFRDDAEELISIRRGAWSFERLIEEARRLEKAVDLAYFTSPLPAQPNRAALNKLHQELVEESFKVAA